MRLRTITLLFALPLTLCSCAAPEQRRSHVPDTTSSALAEGTATRNSGSVRHGTPVALTTHLTPDVPEVLPPPAESNKVSTPASTGEIEAELTIDEVLDHALTHHPSLHARAQEVDIARAQLVTAGLLPNPNFGIIPTTPLGGEGPTDISFRLEFAIPTAGKVQHRKAVARLGINRAAFRLSQETQQVLTDAATAALEVIYLQERLAVQARFGELAHSVVKVQEARFKKGDIAERDLLLAQLDAAQVESDRLTLTGQLQESRLQLARAIGLTQPRPLQMVGQLTTESIPPVSLEQLLAVARELRPDLAESRATVSQSERELSLARALAVPDLAVQPRYREAINDPNDDLGVRLSVDLPVFDRNQGGIAQSQAQIGRAWAILARTEVNTLGDIAALYTQLQAAQERLQFLESKVLPVAERAETAIRRAYETGDINPVEMSLQLQRLLQIRQDQLQLRYLHSQLRTRLEIALGCRLPELQP